MGAFWIIFPAFQNKNDSTHTQSICIDTQTHTQKHYTKMKAESRVMLLQAKKGQPEDCQRTTRK